jgi:hypothetical protein
MKTDIKGFKETFTRLWIRLNEDFQMKGNNSSLQILELRTISGDPVAGVSIGYEEGKGFYIHGSGVNDTGNRVFVPGSNRNYPLSFVRLTKDKWHRIELRTFAGGGDGFVEFWFDGSRRGCIKNQFTKDKSVSSLVIGAVNVSGDSMSGDIYLDDISISDSLLE